ncbi:MAG TPA: hypothetical protein VIH87_14215 [Methylocella sp.]
MLSWLVTRLRSYGVITLVALYAVCVVMPSVAWAARRGGTSSHCLTGDRHGVSDVQLGIHTPGDGEIAKPTDNSEDSGDGKPKCHAGACCGLFCGAAITGDSGATVVQPVHASLLFGALDERLDGCEPKRIGRPPKPFLSL